MLFFYMGSKSLHGNGVWVRGPAPPAALFGVAKYAPTPGAGFHPATPRKHHTIRHSQKRLFFFNGTAGAVIDAGEATYASINITHGFAFIIDFDGFCRATAFTSTTTNTLIMINFNGHFTSP